MEVNERGEEEGGGGGWEGRKSWQRRLRGRMKWEEDGEEGEW